MNINDDSVEIIEEYLDPERTHAVCQQIASISDRLWCVSLRKCSINDSNFEKLIKSIKKCKFIRYLNLNLSVVNTFERLTYMTNHLTNISYLDTLCLHSSNLRDEGLKVLYYSLVNLKHFRSLDIGDCNLTDNSLIYVRELIHRRDQTTKNGLFELVISANPKITTKGWAKILIAVASSLDLRFFHMDYNNLDDCCGYLIAAILTANKVLEVLDLEHTGVGNETAKLLLYCIKSYKLGIKTLNLMNNPINFEYLTEIHRYIPNEYGLDTSILNGFKQTESYDFHNNEAFHIEPRGVNHRNVNDIHLHDQVNIEKFISNANMINDQNLDEYSRNEYVKNLERDYNDLRQRYEKALAESRLPAKQQKNQQTETSQSEFRKYQDEIMSPYDDLRYKTHNILPFNIKSY